MGDGERKGQGKAMGGRRGRLRKRQLSQPSGDYRAGPAIRPIPAGGFRPQGEGRNPAGLEGGKPGPPRGQALLRNPTGAPVTHRECGALIGSKLSRLSSHTQTR